MFMRRDEYSPLLHRLSSVDPETTRLQLDLQQRLISSFVQNLLSSPLSYLECSANTIALYCSALYYRSLHRQHILFIPITFTSRLLDVFSALHQDRQGGSRLRSIHHHARSQKTKQINLLSYFIFYSYKKECNNSSILLLEP